MLFLIFGEDQDVIKVNCHLPFRDQVMENVIHHLLEGGRQVGEPEEYYGWLEQPPVPAECCFLFVSFLDVYIVVPPADIELGEVLGSAEFVDELGDQGEQVAILDHHLVQLSVVLHWA